MRSNDPDALCDEALELFRTALRRAKWRHRLRHLWSVGDLVGDDAWTRALQISDDCALRAGGASTFGAASSEIEHSSPRLSRRLLSPAGLPGQISLARRALGRLSRVGLLPRQDVQAEPAMPLRPLELTGSVHGGDEEIGSLVAG